MDKNRNVYQKNNGAPPLKSGGLIGTCFLDDPKSKTVKLRPHSKECGFRFMDIIDFANEDRLELFSPDTVKKELFNVLQTELELSESETDFLIESLPVNWIDEPYTLRLLTK